MNSLQIELTRLIGKKELSFGCNLLLDGTRPFIVGKEKLIDGTDDSLWDDCNGSREPTILASKFEIIGHPATLTDFHRLMNEKKISWKQCGYEHIDGDGIWILNNPIPYDSSKELLEQSTETLQQIINLINNNK